MCWSSKGAWKASLQAELLKVRRGSPPDKKKAKGSFRPFPRLLDEVLGPVDPHADHSKWGIKKRPSLHGRTLRITQLVAAAIFITYLLVFLNVIPTQFAYRSPLGNNTADGPHTQPEIWSER